MARLSGLDDINTKLIVKYRMETIANTDSYYNKEKTASVSAITSHITDL